MAFFPEMSASIFSFFLGSDRKAVPGLFPRGNTVRSGPGGEEAAPRVIWQLTGAVWVPQPPGCCLGTSAPRMSPGSGPFRSHSQEFRAQEESAESWQQPWEEAAGETR